MYPGFAGLHFADGAQIEMGRGAASEQNDRERNKLYWGWT